MDASLWKYVDKDALNKHVQSTHGGEAIQGRAEESNKIVSTEAGQKNELLARQLHLRSTKPARAVSMPIQSLCGWRCASA